jgi:hypothetical protein
MYAVYVDVGEKIIDGASCHDIESCQPACRCGDDFSYPEPIASEHDVFCIILHPNLRRTGLVGSRTTPPCATH